MVFGLGMGICMIPLSTISVVTLKPDEMTNAAGIQNLFKNIGGAIGTSCVSTILSRSSQMHQIDMVGYLNQLNPVFQTRVNTYAHALSSQMSAVSAKVGANYLMYTQLQQQAGFWAYIDAFRIFGAICFVIIPLLLLFNKRKITTR
jgi:DHA2 family multidrug resistance protein